MFKKVVDHCNYVNFIVCFNIRQQSKKNAIPNFPAINILLSISLQFNFANILLYYGRVGSGNNI